ncbi:MAG: hypothetical protein ACLR7D_01495 [Lachnospira eligens]
MADEMRRSTARINILHTGWTQSMLTQANQQAGCAFTLAIIYNRI